MTHTQAPMSAEPLSAEDTREAALVEALKEIVRIKTWIGKEAEPKALNEAVDIATTTLQKLGVTV